jgi:hypothetical protein
VSKISVGGADITTTGLPAEATIVIGKTRGKYDPLGTDVSANTTGMKTVTGSIRQRWASGDTTLQALIDAEAECEITIEIDVTGSGDSITASGCLLETLTRRAAPGTEVMMIEAPFTGLDWY